MRRCSLADTVKDGGQRTEFATGAQREIVPGKGRFDLIPDDFLRELAKLYEQGAVKYAPHNYAKGMPLSQFKNSAMRHLNQWCSGARDEPHLVQAIWNLISMWTVDALVEDGLLPRDLRDLDLRTFVRKFQELKNE